MIQLAHWLGMTPLAEGIETAGRARVPARGNGCRLAQGFLFSRPVPAEEIPGARWRAGACSCIADARGADASRDERSGAARAGRYHLRTMQPLRPDRDRAEVGQQVWEDEGLYRASDDPDDARPRFYALDMFPYPSGDLHMGHAEAFSGGDAVARYRTMQGYNVLHPIGWDAFGLHAENAAIKRGVHPRSGPTRTSSSRPRRSGGWGCRSTGPGGCTPATPSTTAGRSGCSCGSSSGAWRIGRTRR